MKQTIFALGVLVGLTSVGRAVSTAGAVMPQAESCWTQLQAVYPGATIECRPDEASKNFKGETVGVAFLCVERTGEEQYNQFKLALSAEVWPAEWPPVQIAFIRRHLYASRKDALMQWLIVQRAVEEDRQKMLELEARYEQLLPLGGKDLVYLRTKPAPCDDDYAHGGAHGQIDPQSCDGILFPALSKQEKLKQ